MDLGQHVQNKLPSIVFPDGEKTLINQKNFDKKVKIIEGFLDDKYKRKYMVKIREFGATTQTMNLDELLKEEHIQKRVKD